MSVLGRGVRVGAAAFVVGLSLAGPQAVGVAAADSADADGGAASVSEDAPGSPVRVGRAVPPRLSAVNGARRGGVAPDSVSLGTPTPAAVAPTRLGRASASVKSAAASPSRMQSGSTSGARVAGGGAAAVVGGASGVGDSRLSAAAVSVGVAAVPAAAAASAAVAGADVSGVASRLQSEVAAGTPGDSVTVPEDVQYVVESVSGNILDSLHNFFDSASTWLATLPGGPVRDFLGGALLLVRRTLLPSGPNPFVSGFDSSVGTYDPSVGTYDPSVGTYDPSVGTYDSSVGTYNPPTEPAPNFDSEYYRWYDVQTVNIRSGEQSRLGPVLRGTSGAVFAGKNGYKWNDDGVKGIITNLTGQPIVVEASYDMDYRERFQDITSYAILLPNDWMPYRINNASMKFYGINLNTYKPENLPQPVAYTYAAELLLYDPFFWGSKPYVNFSAAGKSKGDYYFNEGKVVNFVGDGYDKNDIQVTVRRLKDRSWTASVSEAYRKRYGVEINNDWAIFNIEIRSLPSVY
ncbi:MAG: hypothetical protein WCH82_07250 [Mycobacteriaceae bacterium]